MTYQVLARKWRPKQFEEVIGQEHVTRTLQNAIKHNRLAHAYLFTGTRGVGKTSIARLFAKAIRCENPRENSNPCLVCRHCKDVDSSNSLDYIEIDGASNNSVDGIRSLIENVNYLPSSGKYKIYVIDEVHMLSASAFNALLKTLEEPPAHTIFVLATTDPHKLLGTVVSRCQRYDFKHVSVDVLTKQIQKIAQVEGITFSHPNLPRKIASLGKGSVRDALSIFDQVLGLSGNNQVSDETFSLALGLVADSALKSLVSSILKSEVKRCSNLYQSLVESNVDLRKLCDQILDSFFTIINTIDDRESLVKENVIEDQALANITISEVFWIYETLAKDFSWSLTSLNPEKVVLIVIQKVALRRQMLSGDDLVISEIKIDKPEGKEITHTPKVKSWPDFLSHLRSESPTTASNLEHGNLVEEIRYEQKPLKIRLGFLESAGVFKDYLEGKEVYPRLLKNLGEFFHLPTSEIDFKVILLSEEEKKEKNFKTQVEIHDEKKLNFEEERRQKILNDPFVKEAEKIFNSKVDKIILND
jgi:DNA polymerase-3 subunit gamma/tau